jgi:iron complex transport system substrate-binding protein
LRVASLLPSATEIACALGAREMLVGRSHECDHPPEARELPVLTRSRIAAGSSSAIDRDVRRLLAEALALYEIDLEALERTRPDLVMTQDLCQVCAVSFDDVCRAAESVLGAGVEIVSLRPQRLAEIFEDVRRVARAIGRARAGDELAFTLERRMTELGESVRSAAARLTVLSIEWLSPVMIGGLWMPELIDLGGGIALVTRAGEPAPTLGPGELRELDPDVVLVKPCGFGLEQTLAERRLVAEALPWASWRAAREGRVFVADGNAYFNRSGPRIVESLEILAACMHPEAFAAFARKHAASACRLTRELKAVPL